MGRRSGILPTDVYRYEFGLADHGLPDIRLIGVNNQLTASSPLEEHFHAGVMEICYLKKGRQSFEVGGVQSAETTDGYTTVAIAVSPAQ